MARELQEAVLGTKNAVYYLERFARIALRGGGLIHSWNWAAFFFTGLWALYRKLYGWFFVFLGLAMVSGIVEKAGAPTAAAAILLGASILCGVYANALYYNKANRRIERATTAFSGDQAKAVTFLRAEGGIHTWVPWVFGSIPVVGILAAILLPLYQDMQHSDRAVVERNTSPRTPVTSSSDVADLPLEAKDKISGRASLSPTGYLGGNLANGNPDWTVTEVIINVSEPNWFLRAVEAKEKGQPEPRLEKYRLDIVVPPYENKEFSVSVNWRPDEKIEWNVWGARGRKK